MPALPREIQARAGFHRTADLNRLTARHLHHILPPHVDVFRIMFASLKAKNCVKGRQALYAFCKEHGIAHDQCGKVVVATREDELPALEKLYRRGSENGLTGLKKITPDEIREIEPNV
ncbi:FAD-dependent oxidoreductase, partial [candidate division KSB1 bacterium]|nr:FAD-dependent oxidoreductase [candidate division KSB1 bacterium]